ncbi:MAG TPA: class I SAM-dependent rRNA methyltransferase [Myxococcota bacterium]|jgi:23S rRNA (cytosine1962-C5)-methyltransferase|nr:class I SAM-dependent rRNA methyltransferase [Myxococcota bacterium]
MLDLVLHPGRDRSVRRRHPWVLSGAVARTSGDGEAGAWVRVLSAEGETLGFGHWSPASQIRVRLLRFGKDEPGDGLVAERIRAAVARRAGDPLLSDTDAVRLVNAEGDGLPGLVVDRYGPVVVAKLASAGMHLRRALVAEALREASGAVHGFERADATAARREGLAVRQGPLWGEPPPERVEIREGARRYLVDVVHGQKTGFYLDQRDTRALLQTLARGRSVLDLHAYTGGFAVAAAVGGAASVTAVDSATEALGLARENLARNAPALSVRLVEADAHRFLREESATYDLVIADPPPLAKRQGDVERAARAYKDLFLHAMRRGAPGAHVLLFSCSAPIDARLLRQIAFGASLDAARPAVVLRELGAPVDHPIALDHPEGAYLHGLLLRLDG